MPTDYQGNCYSVTDELGNVVERYSFDPWGRRRNPADWTFNNVQTTYTFDRGYTGHEMLDAFGLINMNGRVYDPIIARFLSPDNYVQAPGSSQGFNRYSYCLNNPLTYNDPSGEFPFLVIAAYIAMQGVIAGDMAQHSEMSYWGGFAMGAGTAALSMGVGAAIGPVMAGTGVIPGAVNIMVPAAISGGITYGLNSAITGQPFDWKGFGLNVALAGLEGGIEGGYAALAYNNANPANLKNVWWGGKIGQNRNQWSFYNWDAPDVYSSPVGDNFGKANGECMLRVDEEASRSYGLNKYDFKYWYNQNGCKLGVHATKAEGLIDGTGLFESDPLIISVDNGKTDLSSITNAILNDQRVIVGFCSNGGEHAVMINKVKIWPSGRYRIWFTETSPVRIAPYSTSNLLWDVQGARYYSFSPIYY